jgi:hypothetical protein
MSKLKLILALLLVSSASSLAQTQWTAFSETKGGFKALLPGKPVQSSNSPPTFALGTASGIYVISYTDGHEGGDWAQIQKAERDSTIPGLNGKVSQEKEISLAGYRGKSYIFNGNLPSGAITGPIGGELRLYFNGHRFYMVMAVVPQGSESDAVAKFLDSFQLLPASK